MKLQVHLNPGTWRHLIFAALVAAPCALAYAQSTTVPRPAPGQVLEQKDYPGFDITHLKDRPYTLALPKPVYPSTERVDREFVVEYLYEYAYSKYTPEVTLPVISAVTAKRTTPEDALIAIVSAMRTGDYAAFVKCWDAVDQKQLAADAKEKGQDGAFWQKLWHQVFSTGKQTILVDRSETATYVILNFKLSAPSVLHAAQVFKNVDGQWLATNELGSNALSGFSPTTAGTMLRLPPVPLVKLSPTAAQIRDAQQQFLEQHADRDRTVQAGR